MKQFAYHQALWTAGPTLAWEQGKANIMTGRFVRLAETNRPQLAIEIDGQPSVALDGDTLLVALLTQTGTLRVSEFGDGARAGFCLMGACQDCWVWTGDGRRLRACSTPVAAGMRIFTRDPEAQWPGRA